MSTAVDAVVSSSESFIVSDPDGAPLSVVASTAAPVANGSFGSTSPHAEVANAHRPAVANARRRRDERSKEDKPSEGIGGWDALR